MVGCNDVITQVRIQTVYPLKEYHIEQINTAGSDSNNRTVPHTSAVFTPKAKLIFAIYIFLNVFLPEWL